MLYYLFSSYLLSFTGQFRGTNLVHHIHVVEYGGGKDRWFTEGSHVTALDYMLLTFLLQKSNRDVDFVDHWFHDVADC